MIISTNEDFHMSLSICLFVCKVTQGKILMIFFRKVIY